VTQRYAIRRAVRVVVLLVVLVAVGSQSRTLATAGRRLGHLSWWWVLAAVAAEVVSYLASAELQRRLLTAAGVRVGRLFLTALSYAGSAVSAVLPAGAAVATGYTYRRLTRRGAGSAVTVWVLFASGVVSTAALVALGLAGAEVRGLGPFCSTADWLGGLLIGGSVLGVVGLLAWASQRPSRLEKIGAGVAHVGAWGRSVLPGKRSASRGANRRTLFFRDPISMGTLGWLNVCLVAAANWVADGAVLGLSFAALGYRVPWQGLVLAYVVSQVASSLPLLGCVGLVEASLTVALVCAGVKADRALAAVLVYRLVSFWSVLPVGWVAWAWLRRQDGPPATPVSPALSVDDRPLSAAA
jgi:putative heme transporter